MDRKRDNRNNTTRHIKAKKKTRYEVTLTQLRGWA